MSCDKALYLSGGQSEPDQPYEVFAQCNGMPDCGFRHLIDSGAFGVTEHEVAELAESHRSGRW